MDKQLEKRAKYTSLQKEQARRGACSCVCVCGCVRVWACAFVCFVWAFIQPCSKKGQHKTVSSTAPKNLLKDFKQPSRAGQQRSGYTLSSFSFWTKASFGSSGWSYSHSYSWVAMQLYRVIHALVAPRTPRTSSPQHSPAALTVP